MDWIDVLVKVGSFATFVIFGIAVWIMKKEADKKKASQDPKDEK